MSTPTGVDPAPPLPTPGGEPPGGDSGGTSGGGPRSRRPYVYLVVGVALTALLAVVLFAGIGAGPSRPDTGQQATEANLQPGINAATGLLLSLTVLPPGSNKTAPNFELTDQHGHPVSMDQFRGKVVVFSANDDQCQDLCTLLANDIVLANQDLGRAASDVVWLSVNANPFYPQVSAVRTWTDEHGLGNQANWHFATAAPPALEAVWHQYGVEVIQNRKARTVDHSTELFFVDPTGHERSVAEFGTAAADTSLYAHGIAQMADDLLPGRQQVRVAGPETPAPTTSNATVGAPAPDFSLPYLESGQGTLHLSALRDRYVVVNFWASTCTVCRVELPAIEAAYRSARGHVAFVGVDVSDARGPALSMAARAGLTYPLVSDAHGVASGGEEITGLPYTVVLSPKGQVLVRHPGNLTAEQLEYVLENYDTGMGGN